MPSADHLASGQSALADFLEAAWSAGIFSISISRSETVVRQTIGEGVLNVQGRDWKQGGSVEFRIPFTVAAPAEALRVIMARADAFQNAVRANPTGVPL